MASETMRALMKMLEKFPVAERRSELVAYMLVKVCEADWHAVADVANDLRVLEAQHPELRHGR